ncbi:hypothetical protein OX284_014195 [Flavobacterium sp. SUN046]|uniref:hypothetical protein n=1 Tax=Flavobacterium sp. SUN046 TaxID=3002440 RepID=UPI002DBE3828|nr:hypothetical protein [Flavobacterium sp. SUN046]MEC4050586.1 hypothetical protein [Flavobacterium sp. SUN046]
MNTKNFIPRILVSPFVLCLIIISFSYEALRRWFCFLMYGGEFIVKDSTDNKSIENIYRMLKNKESFTPFTTPETN